MRVSRVQILAKAADDVLKRIRTGLFSCQKLLSAVKMPKGSTTEPNKVWGLPLVRAGLSEVKGF